MKNYLTRGATVALLAATALSLGGCGRIIGAGNRGVRVHFGQVDNESLEEGFYFYNPFSTKIKEVDAHTQLYKGQTASFTSDLQNATVTYALRWRPDKGQVPYLYRTYGDGYADVLIPPQTLSAIKNVFGQFRAPEAVTRRPEIEARIGAALQPVLLRQHIILDGFDILNVQFEKEYSEAVEHKEVAVQNAQAEKNRTVQIQEQANQKVITANAEAESMRVQAAALEANPKLVALEWVRKWKGQMPNTVYCTSATPCIQTGQ